MKGSVENLPYVKVIKWRDGCNIKYLVFPHKTRYGYRCPDEGCQQFVEECKDVKGLSLERFKHTRQHPFKLRYHPVKYGIAWASVTNTFHQVLERLPFAVKELHPDHAGVLRAIYAASGTRRCLHDHVPGAAPLALVAWLS